MFVHQLPLGSFADLSLLLFVSRALGKVAEYIELGDKGDIAVFQSLIPQMVQVLHQTMETGNEDGARKGFDVFETLLILVSAPSLGRIFKLLLTF